MGPKTEQRAINLRRANRRMPRRRFDIPPDKVNYLNPEFLRNFTTDSGKIYSRRTTGVSAKQHRRITREIKRARALNLM